MSSANEAIVCSCGTEKRLSPPEGTAIYRVQNEDTWRSIAVTYNTTTSALKNMNKTTSPFVYPGQIVLVPQQDDLNNEEDRNSTNDIISNLPQTKDDAFSFLTSLSAPSTTTSSLKPFRDLAVISTGEEATRKNIIDDILPSFKTNGVLGSADLFSTKPTSQHQDDESFVSRKRGSFQRERMFSSESGPFEENFLKLPVYYITAAHELVGGVLLVTPTSVMFDPDPSDPLAAEHGCEKFGIMCNMTSITRITMYKEWECFERYNSISSDFSASTRKITLSESEDNEKNDVAANKTSDGVTPDDAQPDSTACKESRDEVNETGESRDEVNETGESRDEVNETGDDKPNKEDENKLMFEFPFLHSLVKTVEVLLPGNAAEAEDGNKSTSSGNQKNYLYLCIRSKDPMMKTFSVISSLNEASDKDLEMEDDIRESWFQVPQTRSDQMLAFFMQWSPDNYALDFAEHGFVMVDTLEDAKKNVKKANVEKEGKSNRSSTATSLDFIEDFFSDKRHKIEKEWELISIGEEGVQCTSLNANELADEDASLLPELLSTSALLNDETLLTLCKHMPARCVGYPWKLLYSTYEHGISLKTLFRNMNISYEDSPAIMLIKDQDNAIFGAFCSSRPHVSDHFYGNGESFLFTLEPNIQFFDWSGENNFFIKGDLDALMLGGGDGSAGLWLDAGLYHGCTRQCLTFNNLLLSANEDFYIQGLEVWGLHGS